MKERTYSFKDYELTDKIREEMLSKVDMDKLRTLFMIGSRINKSVWDENNYHVDELSIKWYLDEWVESKYLYYIAMKRNLKLHYKYQFEATVDDIYPMLKELKEKYPEHKRLISCFNIRCYLNNRIDSYNVDYDIHEILEYYDVPDKVKSYNNGMKISKFLSRIVNNEQFDIDLSMILQNRKVTQDMYISIDPIDYLSASFTKESWRSCYHIGWGCYSSAMFSAMIDTHNIIVYTTNNKIVNFNSHYDENDFSVELPSKRFRMFVTINQDNVCFNIHYCQGNPPEDFYGKVEDYIKEIIDYGVFHGHCHNPIVWYKKYCAEWSGLVDHISTDKKYSVVTKNSKDIRLGIQDKEKLVDILNHREKICDQESMTRIR